jgi:hypothetical protein
MMEKRDSQYEFSGVVQERLVPSDQQVTDD